MFTTERKILRAIVKGPMTTKSSQSERKATSFREPFVGKPMSSKRIPITSAQVGMYLCGIDRSWLETPFLLHRFFIESSSDIAKLQQAGIQEITIDPDPGIDVALDSDARLAQEDDSSTPDPTLSHSPVALEVEPLQPLPLSVQGKSLSGELVTMKSVQKHMLEGVQDILQILQKTGGLAMEQVHQITTSVMAETLQHEEACMAMIRTRDFSPALYEHALAVSTLAVLLGRANSVGQYDVTTSGKRWTSS